MAPGVFGLPEHLSPVGIHPAESAKGLEGRIGPEAVDLDQRVEVLHFLVHARDVNAQLTRKLPAISEDVFVGVGLGDVGVQLQAHLILGGGWRQVFGLEHTVAVKVVGDPSVDGAAAQEPRHVIAPGQGLVGAGNAASQNTARVAIEHVGHPQARADLGAVLPGDIEDLVLTLDKVDADADVQREPRTKLDRILHVQGEVSFPRRQLVQAGRRDKVAAEGDEARPQVVGIAQPHLL